MSRIETDHCCFCFSVKTGVYILGVMMMLSCVSEIWHPIPNPFRWAVKLFAAGTFVYMHMRDNSLSRKVFFYTYIANIFALSIVNALTDDSDDSQYNQLDHLNFDKIAMQTCQDMKPEEKEEYGYKSDKECMAGMRSRIYKVMLMFMILAFGFVLIIQLHFI